jgi:uncharacterized membrane protein YdjX (TVP38/TMEM64 family)
VCRVGEDIALGAASFTIVYAVVTTVLPIGAILTVAAGAVFADAAGQELGVLIASCVVFVGASAGAIVSFLLARYLLANTVRKWYLKYRIMTAIDKVVATQGLKIVMLLRLSPLMPFTPFNYVMGLTNVTFYDYTVGSIGMIPGVVGYVYIGSAIGSTLSSDCGIHNGGAVERAEGVPVSGTESATLHKATDAQANAGKAKFIVLALGAVSTVLVVLLISYYARKALDDVLERGQEGGEEKGYRNEGVEKKKMKGYREAGKEMDTAEITTGDQGDDVSVSIAEEQAPLKPSTSRRKAAAERMGVLAA